METYAIFVHVVRVSCYLVELCETVLTGLPMVMDTERLRCKAVSYEQRKSNYHFVNITFLFGDTYEMVKIPSTVNEGDVLCCSNITKRCMWRPCPALPLQPKVLTPPKIIYFKIIFFCRNEVNVVVDIDSFQYWIAAEAHITDKVTDICVKEKTIKVTIEILDVNYYSFNTNLGTTVNKVSMSVFISF